jgi:hypothetical protein
MPPADLLQALRRRPFMPFRLEVSDGTAYEVRHPELVMVGLGSVLIGVAAEGQSQPLYERTEYVDLRHVVKLIPLNAPAGDGGNGQS